jgi:hypothetical protein
MSQADESNGLRGWGNGGPHVVVVIYIFSLTLLVIMMTMVLFFLLVGEFLCMLIIRKY